MWKCAGYYRNNVSKDRSRLKIEFRDNRREKDKRNEVVLRSTFGLWQS